MTTQQAPTIASGHNRFDPLADIARFEALPLPQEQEAAVTARCPELFRRAAGLCMRYAVKSGVRIDDFETPHIIYSVQPALGCLVRLVTTIKYSDTAKQTPLGGRVRLQAYVREELKNRDSWGDVIELGTNSIVAHAGERARAGTHGYFNYLDGVVDKIKGLNLPGAEVSAALHTHYEYVLDVLTPQPTTPGVVNVDIPGGRL